MNWTKLKSSLIVIVIILGISGISNAASRQLSDTTGQQPAKSILKIALQHLQEQNPSTFNSYSAITYHRFRIKTNFVPLTERLVPNESLINQNNTNYIFSTESLTSLKRMKPDFNQSEKLSSKIEGQDDGSYAILAWQLTNISILEPAINIFSKSYLSPFTNAASDNYDFHSSDSISVSGDTLCLVTFHPKEGKRFDGFTGTVAIHKKDLTIQQISARSTQYDPDEPLLLINQNFERLKELSLPSERKIIVHFNKKGTPHQDNHFIAESITNIYQQEINPLLSPADFKAADQPSKNIDPTSTLSAGNYSFRPINQNDSLLQLKADSAMIADIQNRQLKMIRLMAEGKISLDYFNLDYNRIFGYNLFEGIKLGLGGETSRKMSTHFTVGGYISYGLKDKSIHHGEWINIYPTGQSDLRIHLGYRDMNLEFGGPEFLETRSLLNPESYRNLLIKNMFATKRYSTGLEFSPFNGLKIYLFGDLSENSARQNTEFLLRHAFNPISLTRTGLQLRYSPGIKLQMEDGHMNEIEAPMTDFFLTMIQGLSILDGEYRYSKIELKGKFELPFSKIGKTTIMIRGGATTRDTPMIELFNGYGSFAGTFSLAVPYSFGTMQLNEFAAANYTALHLRHDFSTWLFPETFQKKPALIFAQNIGFGQLDDQQKAQFNLKDYRQGFYESGFEINNLLRMNYLSWGVGIYYRYGPYQFSSIHENFAYKFGFFFKL